MRIAVVGLWHLGTVTAAALASGGHDVVGLDFDSAAVRALEQGRVPVAEPGLAELVAEGAAAGRLRFSSDPSAVADRDVVWIAYDTPVDEDDRADVDYVVERAGRVVAHVAPGALVLISSQLPVGTTARLEAIARGLRGRDDVRFACVPENLRLGQAIAVFTRPDRVVAGARTDADRETIRHVLAPFTDRIEFMSVESAEMTKHALNAFLATSVVFANEIATLCESVGADAGEVARGLKSDARIGAKAYLAPGGAFAGGTLARDVVFLGGLGRAHGVATDMLTAVKTSNDRHRSWPERRLTQLLGGVADRTVGVWGLTYKPGTDTLRRSSAVELCVSLAEQGATVRAHDPAVRALPPELAERIALAPTPLDAVEGASALVVATPWPIYREVEAGDLLARMARPLVLDAGGFLAAQFAGGGAVEYLRVGAGA